MKEIFDSIIDHYGWQGMALGGAIFTLLCVQLYYYLIAYGRISSYRNARRKKKLTQEPPISVVVPLFSEDYAYLENRLPHLFEQQYGATYEVVIVYVGNDSDFYEELERLRLLHPNLVITKFNFNPRFPISVKQAINLGIKSSHNEHIIISTPDAKPASAHWLVMMGRAFMRGDVVIGYSGIEAMSGFGNYLMRVSNLQMSIYWLAQAVKGRTYRGIRHNLGFTKSLYFGVKGFSHLSMNIGEDDLFIQQIAKRNNASVVMIPKGSVIEHPWGGLRWWLGRLRHYGQTWKLYPTWANTAIEWDLGSQALLFITALTALIFMPLEFKAATLVVLLLRYIVITLRINSIAKRVGEKGVALKYFLFDLINPLLMLCLGIIMLRKDSTAWK
jgi:hypothetical protein